MTGYQDELAAGFLLELRADPVRAIEGIELTLSQQRGGSQQWADLAMSMSEFHGLADPVDPSAAAFCDHCGAVDDLAEDKDGGTVPCRCHGMVVRHCRDVDGCVSRRSERYPPDLARVPLWVITAGSETAAAADVARLVRLAAGQAASDYLALVQQAAEAGEIRLAGQQEPWVNQYGAYDTRGAWFPAQPAYNFNWSHFNWAHTLRNQSHHQHLISGNGLTPARLSAMAKINGARAAQVAPGGAQSHQEAPGGQSVPGGQGTPQTEVFGVPGGAHQGQEGGDIPMGQGPGFMQRLAAPEPPPRAPRDRYGRRRSPRAGLRYTGRRQVVRKPAQHPPGDSGWGSAGEGPSGGSSET